ncbi:hypothetical protein [Candidatus Paracaedibacter symbiosus]|uniref:hypothetical protein n=1 Tax=Candidatus Paracaedibacter symbiosus TaxID=244582 RepID=UPI000509D4D1|nr:hypothetical protein [Candidatus Paracaedibacter symbiosus]
MAVKTIDEIQEEFWENECLSPESIKDLRWHLQYNPDPHMAIIIATDAGLTSLAPLIAHHLDDEDDFIRERTVGCLVGRLFQSQYAEKAFQMAKEDKYENVRDLAVSVLGAVIDNAAKKLQLEIAEHIYHVLTSPGYDKLHKQSAYHSIVVAMHVPPMKWPQVKSDPNIEELIDKELLEKFCKKYNVKMTS